MTKGALYRHYKSKRDIFDCIVHHMEQQDGEQARENEVPEESIEKTPEEYHNVSLDDFVKYSKSMFEYWTEDDFASSFRKMLTIEILQWCPSPVSFQNYSGKGTRGVCSGRSRS